MRWKPPTSSVNTCQVSAGNPRPPSSRRGCEWLRQGHLSRRFSAGVSTVSTDLLREGAPIEPDPPVSHWKPEAVYYEDGARIEAAFRSYIHRADTKQQEDSYEIFICHANVIRYIVCR